MFMWCSLRQLSQKYYLSNKSPVYNRPKFFNTLSTTKRVRWRGFFLSSLFVSFVATGGYFYGTDNEMMRVFIRPFLHNHVRNLGNPSKSLFQKIHSARRLAYLSADYEDCKTLVKSGLLNACVSCLDKENDVQLLESIAKTIFHVSQFEGLVENLMEKSILQKLQFLSEVQDPIICTYVQKTITELLKIEDSERIFQEIKFSSLLHLLSGDSLIPFKNTLIPSLVKFSREKNVAQYETEPGQFLSFMKNLSGSKNEKKKPGSENEMVSDSDLVRILANVTINSQFDKNSLEDILSYLEEFREKKDNLDVMKQITRAIANLASEVPLRSEIISRNWLPFLYDQLNVEDQQTRLSSLVALGNLSSEASAASLIIEEKRLFSFFSDLIRPESTLIVDISFETHLSRLLSNLTTNSALIPAVWRKIGSNTILALMERTGLETRIYTVKALSRLTTNASVSAEIVLNEKLWVALLHLAQTDPNPKIKAHATQAIANLAIHEAKKLWKKEGLVEFLRQCVKSDDEVVRMEAIRAQASLADLKIKGPKYADGIFLFYPNPSNPNFDEETLQADIVFIHGLTGDPIGTWTVGNTQKQTANHLKQCWPRDWLPEDIPSVRILSVGYECMPSSWQGSSLSLASQSRIILEKLKLASVGTRPVIFVTHSFGGLLVKQFLDYASNHEKYRYILEATRGVVFFSVPHLGSKIPIYTKTGWSNIIIQGNPVLEDLAPSQNLIYLNNQFLKIAPDVGTLSFGESDTCFSMSKKRTYCIQLVMDSSANPGYPGPNHVFVKLEANHRSVCKPNNKEDKRYTLTRDFITEKLGINKEN